MKRLVVFGLMLALGGCSTSTPLRERSMSLSTGLSQQQVLALMGVPNFRSIRENREIFEYCDLGMLGTSWQVVWFENDALVGLSSYENSASSCSLGRTNVEWAQPSNGSAMTNSPTPSPVSATPFFAAEELNAAFQATLPSQSAPPQALYYPPANVESPFDKAQAILESAQQEINNSESMTPITDRARERAVQNKILFGP